MKRSLSLIVLSLLILASCRTDPYESRYPEWYVKVDSTKDSAFYSKRLIFDEPCCEETTKYIRNAIEAYRASGDNLDAEGETVRRKIEEIEEQLGRLELAYLRERFSASQRYMQGLLSITGKIAELSIAHSPLNHKDFRIISRPRSDWKDGWMYHTEVIEYLFKTKPERDLAVLRLNGAGFGDGRINFVYIDGKNISVNGYLLKDLKAAKAYIRKKGLRKVLYTDKSRFPKQIPDELKMDGVEFWLIDWRK